MAANNAPTTENGRFVCDRLLELRSTRMEDLLRRHTPTLYKDTYPNFLAIHLAALGVISSYQKDECETKLTKLEKNVYLYGIIFRKNYVAEFILALERTDENEHVIKSIKDFLNQEFPKTAAVKAEGLQPTTANGKQVFRLLSGPTQMQDLLRSHMPELYRITNPEFLAEELAASGVISSSQVEQFNSKATPRDKSKFLYNIIFQKKCVAEFIVALENIENEHVLESIKVFLKR